MIVQNNSTPWVVLAIFVMAGCALTGMILGNVGPFNSQVVEAKIPVQQTQGALDSIATQSAMELLQTQQAPVVQQTAMVALMTTVPLQQTATQAAVYNAIQSILVNATQTSISDAAQNSQTMMQATQTSVANGLYLQNLSSNATASAIVHDQIQARSSEETSFVLISVGVLLACGWIVARIITQIMIARAREKVAHAQLLAEQRRLANLRASILIQKEKHRLQYPFPTTLMEKPSNGKGLPKAE